MASLSITTPLARRQRFRARRLLRWLTAMWHATVTRRYLADMDARMLQDIGITRAEAQEEASRRPWDLGPR